MLRAAATAYFERRKAKKDTFEQEFRRLMKEYESYSDRRNDIAHGTVKQAFVTEKRTNKGHRNAAIGFYLFPSFYNPRKFKLEKFEYQYTSSDVLHYKQEFTKLCLRINGLCERMMARRQALP
jgi:hypothetical protein